MTLLLIFILSLILLFLSLSEASITAISRRRTPASTGDLTVILRRYINQRQDILSSISSASTAMLIILTILIAKQINLLTGDIQKSLTAIIVVIITASLIRQTARQIALLNPEFVGYRLSKLIDFVLLIFSPFIWVVTRPVNFVSKLLGRDIKLIEPSFMV